MIRTIEVDTGFSFPEVLTLKTNTMKEMISLIDNIEVISSELGWNKTINVPNPYIIQCEGHKHLVRKFDPKTDTMVNEC